MNAQEMLRTHPAQPSIAGADLVRCIEECFACAQACTACADACLGEDQPDSLRRCIRLCLDCADVCIVTGNILSRLTQAEWNLLRRQVETCQAFCRDCGEECERHAPHHEHCRACREACQRCEDSCRAALEASPA